MSNRKKKSSANRLESYAGEWVALTFDQRTIVGHSKDLNSALKQAYENGEKFPHIVKVPNESTASVIY